MPVSKSWGDAEVLYIFYRSRLTFQKILYLFILRNNLDLTVNTAGKQEEEAEEEEEEEEEDEEEDSNIPETRKEQEINLFSTR